MIRITFYIEYLKFKNLKENEKVIVLENLTNLQYDIQEVNIKQRWLQALAAAIRDIPSFSIRR